MNKKNCYSLRDSTLTFLLSVILPQILGTVVVSIILIFVNDLTSLNTNIYYLLFSLLFTQFIFAGIIWFINSKKKYNFSKACSFNKNINIWQILIAIIIGLVALYSFAPVVNLFDYLLQSIGYDVSSSVSFALPFDNFFNFLLMTVCYAIVPAFIEEILFRGIIFNGLRKKGLKFALIIGAFIFMIMHANLQQTLYQFALGLVLCSVMYITGNIWLPIILHFFNNFFVVLISYITYGTVSEAVTYSSFSDYIMPIAFMIIGSVLIFYLLKLLKKCTKNSCPKYEEVSVEQITDVNTVKEGDEIEVIQTESIIVEETSFEAKLNESTTKIMFWSSIALSVLIYIASIFI